ncbi:phosphotransferase [Chitinophagaceae bacterium LB-8]|uniref:Phosphotransferase n=1 Tax=Paraflavisolibacter caeni TaxID=2982496 RepID=A0A9X3BIZ4_9BACT|nr:RNase adapter RapZ [Paraflavisolibacter caeni]MCU7550673.1 phosphotransferase [Paraflavisolibacter caeni]
MQQLIDAISKLYIQWKGMEPLHIDILPESGSNRRYFRIHGQGGESIIGTYGTNIKENETFLYFSDHFKQKHLPVPQILAVSEDKSTYLQQDLGDIALLHILEEKGTSDEVYTLFKKSLQELARLQVLGDNGLDYNLCLTNKEFGKQAIMSDLLYFKFYFLDVLQKPYDKQNLIDDFEALSNYLTHTEYKYFMFRDFQSRNIMVQDGNVHFIDFQGGMKGAPQYDVASMLWQAKANLPDEWKTSLLEDYMDAFEEIIQKPLDRAVFRTQYNGYVLIRLLQVLGAYGFRGLFERKAHFLTSIPFALKNLKWFIENNSLGLVLPEFRKVLEICVDEEVIKRFTPIQADEGTPLVVKICSFSYKKGIPVDESGNGGGFVFDCRGIENPGRYEQYKTIHGRNKPVMDFLERQTRMLDFLNSVYDIVDISVEDYIRRGFSNLAVNFGCTGGQHRSVYAADALAKHLKNKYKVKVEVCHVVQEEKKWINELVPAVPKA